jgi:uncharacterized protein YbcI
MSDAPATNHGRLTAEISRSMVQLIRDYTGRGPTQARTMIMPDTVMVVLADTLTKGERKLVEHGRLDQVLQTRQQVQRMMRDDAVAMIESAVDRKVVAFFSDNHADPDMAVEVFLLEPEETTGALGAIPD